MHVPDLAGSVQVGCGGALVTTTEIDPLSLATSVVQMVVGHGLVHARIGIAGQWEDEMLHISHWETSRVVSRRVSCTIRSVLQLDGQVTKEMSEQMEAMGIDHNLSLDLLPMLTGSLERLVDAEPKLPDLLCPRPAQLPTVPDDLGLVYATACLMGTATLLGDMGTNADWTYGSSDGFSAANP